ncbi:MAG: hypothetical protein AAGG75_10960 [Bacteroidota bacterium]
MKPLSHYFLPLLVVIVLGACQQPSNQIDYTYQKSAVLSAQLFKPMKESIAIIYDYDPIRAKLESRAVKVQPSSGDPLQDALKAFFATNRINGSYEHLQFKELRETEDKEITFVFSGQPQHQSDKDKMLFDMALEMTIARNYKSMDYTVKFEL